MASFSFSFSGDDIDGVDDTNSLAPALPGSASASTPAPPVPAPAPTPAPTPGAFPVPGKPQLPPQRHSLSAMLAQLPSRIAYDTLPITLDSGQTVLLPRRELWDVRVQLMAEDDPSGEGRTADGISDSAADPAEGLGTHDVKTGVYEGGFKSWESSVDLVKVLAAEGGRRYLGGLQRPMRVIELGCGTALPTLFLFHAAMAQRSSQAPNSSPPPPPLSFILADYNPTVLHLVTLPNLLLTWALAHRETSPALRSGALSDDEQGKDLELTPHVLAAFQSYLVASNITLAFLSGGWSPQFVELLYQDSSCSSSAQSITTTTTTTTPDQNANGQVLVLGAETIYSPFALAAFLETVFAVLRREAPPASTDDNSAVAAAAAVVAAKRLYFGVGGSLDDFVDRARQLGAVVTPLREETGGVSRGVVECVLGT